MKKFSGQQKGVVAYNRFEESMLDHLPPLNSSVFASSHGFLGSESGGKEAPGAMGPRANPSSCLIRMHSTSILTCVGSYCVSSPGGSGG